MHLGISSYSYPWAVGVAGFMPPHPLQALDLLHKAQQNKVKSLQFGDNLPLHLLSNAELETLKEHAQQTKIALEVGTRRLTPTQLDYYLPIAQSLCSPFLRVVIDDADYHPGEEEVLEIIQEVVGDFREAGIVLALENHDRFPVGVLKRIIESTDPQWVGICLDTANSLGAGEGIREVVTVLAPYTVNLHVKDFTVRRVSHKMGFVVEGCAAGAGMLDIPWILEQLRPYNRCLSATLEVWSDPKETIELTMEQENAWVEQSLHYLKSLHW